MMVAMRVCIPSGILPPKAHGAAHLKYFVDKYHTIGWFGEDGMEALHPADSAVRILTRAMRNPKARHQASSNHLTARQTTEPINMPKRKRRASCGSN